MLKLWNKSFIKLIIGVGLFVIIFSQPVSAGDDWLFDLDQALKEAKSQNKMLLVNFTAEWCRFCTMMNVEIFQKKEIRKMLCETCILVSIDADQQRAVVQKFGVQGFPTIIFLNHDGTEKHRIVGYRSYSEFLEEMKKLR